MKKTLSGQITRLFGKIKKFTKKSKLARRFLLTMVAVWLVIPVLTVNAAETNPVVQSAESTIVLDQTLATVKPQFKVEIRTSPHAQAKAVAMAKAQAAAVNVPSADIADPGYDVKMEWAKKAAAAWSIDWKILAAVWKKETGLTWNTNRGSSAGARGPCQFMPGTWRAYAQDGNGDGIKNQSDARDCLFASAKLLSANGASTGNIDNALLHYNHSLAYVASVKQLATGF